MQNLHNADSKRKEMNLQKYILYLEEDGWTELIGIRWKNVIHQVLTSKFPDITEEEWSELSRFMFIR